MTAVTIEEPPRTAWVSGVSSWCRQGRGRPQLGFPEPRWTVPGRPAWAWRDLCVWSVTSGRMVTVVNSEEEANDFVPRRVTIPGQGDVPILGYRPTASGTFVLTSVPQAALDLEPEDHPMDGAWKLRCGRWLMPDQLPEIGTSALLSAPRPATTTTPWYEVARPHSEAVTDSTFARPPSQIEPGQDGSGVRHDGPRWPHIGALTLVKDVDHQRRVVRQPPPRRTAGQKGPVRDPVRLRQDLTRPADDLGRWGRRMTRASYSAAVRFTHDRLTSSCHRCGRGRPTC